MSSRASSQSCSQDEQSYNIGLGTCGPRVKVLGVWGVKGKLEKLAQVESVSAKKDWGLKLKFLFLRKDRREKGFCREAMKEA